MLKLNGIYKHYKGNLYVALGIALHTETKEKLVVYRRKDSDSPLDMWARPYDMFFELVDGKPRFELIREE